MSELFDEVNEEVRREQFKKLWDKYSIYFIALMVLIVAGAGGWQGYRYLEAKKAAEAGAAFEKAAELSEQGKHEDAEKAFTELAAKAPSGYRTLARLRAAAEAASRDPKAAAKMYDDIAADRSIGGEWQDLAKIRAAGLLLDSAGYADIQQRLEASAAPKSTFRHTAREMLALSAWRNNDMTAARKWLEAIDGDGETPPGLRSRAEALQALLPPVAKS
ncbi:tetratricopeptide repeat protein [Bradyrhizobium yuanmingense]|uniref:tetratricopeptide repeat protein n=1 Tax=Bradyrhizobium TaxID=374 RepID=UPI0013601136|nr:tetratricopeptide repeat protein [Bradyrhizobium yuanmingense]MCA1380870.1 tetratricopeptide repeat protein [Bradyrhizobium sp. BRP05]MCA1419008.1 tetratricopeptide repeat protein [Bradyrhizobium sp. BRP23]MDF0495282.1 tetratricopeptide repeat protein [Bradyrhizobium yuanmingense]MDF0519666.1 tetratricopeptide repeat protein [Bradyrhizobium yuanmingense]MDF0580839.1 tetratricopeptide repeat protein [Bradyrhizobium yuanmingense]